MRKWRNYPTSAGNQKKILLERNVIYMRNFKRLLNDVNDRICTFCRVMKYFIVLLVAMLCFSCSSKKNISDGTIYKNQQNRFLIDSMYQQRLNAWPVPYEEIVLETTYGKVSIIASGNLQSPPVFLMHPMGVTATVWSANFADLSRHFRVYAINTIGDIGRSELADINHYPRNGLDYVLWLDDIADQLGIEKVKTVGASMGGWIMMNYAMHSQKVEKLVLLGPMGLKANTFGVMRRLTKVVANPSEKNKTALINWALGDNPRVQSEMVPYMNIAANCEGKMPVPKRLSKKTLGNIQAPVLLLLGEKDNPIGNHSRNSRFALKAFNDIRVQVLDSGHLINVEKAEEVNNLVIEFFMDPVAAE
jgi:pimeloyl-ACP methyl ester carboxylesterase